MTVSVMLDLETWGTTPGSDIRSIGACVFDPVAGTVCDATQGGEQFSKSFYIATDNPNVSEYAQFGQYAPKYPLTRNLETVAWWNDQTDEARAAFADPVELREALDRFAAWLDNVHGCDDHHLEPGDKRAPLTLWSHGAAFDPPILAAAYAAVGLPVPWHYRAPRDTRTAFDMAGVTDHSAWLAQHPGPLGVQHHALDDAISQARAVCAAHARVRDESMNAFFAGWDARDIAAPSINAVNISAEKAYDNYRSDGVQLIDLDRSAWRSIQNAAAQSKWMPPEYMSNDWLSDVRDFLINGPRPDGSPDREFHVGRIAMQRYADWTNQAIDIGGAWSAIEQAIRDGAK